jgi:GNAT superfamily N-acetyltransferase
MLFDIIHTGDLENLKLLQPEGWPDIVPEFEKYIRADFCYPIKALVDDTIAGIGTLMLFEDTAWIGHMIVDKEFRNRGIGYRILTELLNILDNTSIETCLLIASELGRPLYLKAGFRDVTEYCFMRREKPWEEKSVHEKISRYMNDQISVILELDQKVTGENREKLIMEHLKDASVYIDNSTIQGFYLPKLKEGPIIAENEKAGLALMELKYSGPDKAVLPSDNKAGIRFLDEHGFVKSDKKGTRMIRGKDIDWKPENIYSRIGGNFG